MGITLLLRNGDVRHPVYDLCGGPGKQDHYVYVNIYLHVYVYAHTNV